jgi:hypothetical protein
LAKRKRGREREGGEKRYWRKKKQQKAIDT